MTGQVKHHVLEEEKQSISGGRKMKIHMMGG